ncbi:MAG: 4-alpha-glucanotransferase [Roseicyclus sp.]
MTDDLRTIAARAGILSSYSDQTGQRRRTGRDTTLALLAALGLPAGTRADRAAALAILRAEEGRSVPAYAIGTPGEALRGIVPPGADWALTREDGGTGEGRGDTLPALPLGLHHLRQGGWDCTLIVAPARLPLPPRIWGMMLPLHGLRPPGTGGLADYEDLAVAAEGMGRLGADFLGLNPIHAGFFAAPESFSPYTPSHRRRLSAFHIPDGARSEPSGPLVDYSLEIPRRRAALEAAHADFVAAGGDPAFDAFRRDEGAALSRFALHQALSDRLGPTWSEWPMPYRDPESAEVRAAEAELQDAAAFHAWLQWRAEGALGAANARARAAGMGLGLYLDLAVGTHPHGAETWEDRESFAFGASLGAPPDAFSAEGQAWGLAPFNPRALVAKGFRPLAETLRRQMSLSGAIRIDHVLGFDRAFWVPETGAPGAYLRMPRDAMLAVLRLEAARNGTVVVGEDLGNVPRGLRAALEASGILGCQVQLFERLPGPEPVFRPPARFKEHSVASFSTHDLPTWAGWRGGRDIDARLRIGDIAPDFAAAEHARRKTEVAAFDAMTRTELAGAGAGTGAEDPASALAMHRMLAATRSALALVQIECALGMEEQPNLPGTTTEYPNWRQRLPLGPAELAEAPGVREAAEAMAQAGRADPPAQPTPPKRT